MTTVYLIRHAEAEGNIFRRLHGQYDSLLTPRGFAQVAALERRFSTIPVDGCFSSDLTRTSLTSRAVYIPKGLHLHRDPRFREVDVGSWEDMPIGNLCRKYPQQLKIFTENPPEWHVERSEPFDVYTQRFLEGMRDAAQRFDGGTVAIFGHGAVIRGTLMRLFPVEDMRDFPYCDNTGVCKLKYERGEFRAEFLNDSSHLPEVLTHDYLRRWRANADDPQNTTLFLQPEGARGDGLRITGSLPEGTAGSITLAGTREGVGYISEMELKQSYVGRYYADQLLGCAFSHFRKLGCKEIEAAPGDYPEDILARYAFDTQSRRRSIDTEAFSWETP